MRQLLVLGVVAALVNSVQQVEAAEPEPAVNPVARDFAKRLGFDDADVERVESGDVLVRQLREEGKKELSTLLFALLPLTTEKARARFESGAMLDADTTILDWGTIGEKADAASFDRLRLPNEELEKLAGDDVEDDFNLSGEELALLEKQTATAKSAADRKNAAMQAYREILAGRAAAYRARGLAGIAPYRHGRDTSNPRADLETALPAETGLVHSEAPDFYAYLHDYPKGGSVSSEKLVWLLQVLNGRPAVILAHRAESQGENSILFVQRDFYVGHTFDALQILGGLVPVDPEHAALFYSNATFTEQVAGFASGAAHGIGRKIMTEEILALFQTFRTGL